ncbi:hypothetical protein LT493_28980 [Streptomyces tricolor]|nr:hypothetical protein [Streptomyces tricolor]
MLLTAESLATLDRVCVHYRHAPAGQHPRHHEPQALRPVRAVRPGVRVRRGAA